jgi:hypothetical protein
MNPKEGVVMTEKYELIEQALQESVGGGQRDFCGIQCHIFSVNICNTDLCGLPDICMIRPT